jgi:hypothetical protein
MTVALRALARTLVPGAALFSLGACAGTVAEPVSVAAAPSGPALWKVADKDTTIYMFGTVHVLPETANWYDGRVSTALAASDSIVTELPMSAMEDPASQQLIMGMAMLPPEKSLRAMLTADQRATYEAAMAKLKMPPETFDRFEPWFAAMTLSVLPLMQNGYKLDKGVEKVLEGKAGSIERGAVETLEGQMKLFDELPLEAQVAFLTATAANIDKVVPSLDAMVAAWQTGDADKLAELMNDSLKDDPALADRLLYARNRNWAQWIDDRLDRPGTVFMAVGAGHLAGNQSVQDALAARGIKSMRVK